jgi:predicted metal-binding membrane protein
MERMPARTRWEGRAAALALAVAALAAACWAEAARGALGMGMGATTDPGVLSSLAATSATMMAAMMLPSALPALLAVDRAARARAGGGAPAAPAAFAAGYLAVWTAVGVGLLLAYRDVGSLNGARAVGAAVIAAGLYELTPLKRAFLRRCRAAGEGVATPAPVAGLRYGAECTACCAGLMVALFAIGAMSMSWMLTISGLILVQKVAPAGTRVVVAGALALIGLGLWIVIAPGSVPGLSLGM